MASDFEYLEIQNHQYILRERSTGMRYTLDTGMDDQGLTLLDGDEVEIKKPIDTWRYSIRERRRIG